MNVFIINSSPAYVAMWEEAGHVVVPRMILADIVQFTGGSDVDPELYGEKKHHLTGMYQSRDDYEVIQFKAAKALDLPMVGICRGGQFLNVMCGGKMFQDVDGHAIAGCHEAFDLFTGQPINVTSTHHQMMRAGSEGTVVCVAKHIATKKEHMPMLSSSDKNILKVKDDPVDTEVVWYEDQNCLCFQPHPEFANGKECRKYYFELISRFITK